MTVNEILNIVLTVLVVAMGAYSTYLSTGKDIYSKVSYLINEAKNLDLIGKEKMALVVEQLYNIVPLPWKKFLTKEKLESIAQGVYDNMNAFAQKNKNKDAT